MLAMITAYLGFVAALMKIVRVVIGVLLILSVCLNLANVLGRYVLHAPIVGAEEVMVFFMVGIVFLGFPRVMWEGRHIRMDIAVKLLPRPLQRVMDVVVALASVAAGGIILYLAEPIIVKLAMFDERSQAANVPLAIPEAMIPIGFGLMILVTIAQLIDPAWRDSERGEEPA